MSDRYSECPLRAAGFRLEDFNELPTLAIGADGKCLCVVGQRCLNVDKEGDDRCTLEQLRQLDREAIQRRAWQSRDGL